MPTKLWKTDAGLADFKIDRPGRVQQTFDVILGTDLIGVDPDRRSGEDLFGPLRGVLLLALEVAPQSLVLLSYEERGPLRLENLGALFVPLLDVGEVWEFQAPASVARPCVRHLCLRGSQAGEAGPFEAWRQLLLEAAGGGEGGRFERLDLGTFIPEEE